jgi:hypothetical protein
MTIMTLRDVAKVPVQVQVPVQAPVQVQVQVQVSVQVPVQGFDAYFFDFMNCFREIQSLSFLVCDDILKSMKVMNHVARFSAYDQDSDDQF